MIHMHRWVEQTRKTVENLVALLPDDDGVPRFKVETVTQFLFRCVKCNDVKVTEVKGHWAK